MTNVLEQFWFDAADGTRLFAAANGAGPALILLHGGLATHAASRLFGEPLAARFRLITPDLRGSGQSHFHGELTWDLLADDVAALARHLGVTRAVIAGPSFGSGVATRVALRHPSLVAGLVLLAPVYPGGDLGLTAAQRGAMTYMDAAGRRAPEEGIEAIFPLFDALPAEIRDRAQAMARAYDPRSVATSTRFMASGAQPLATAADLAGVTAPALIVPGTDPYHPREVADLLARHLPRATIVEAEAPEYAKVIAAFLEDV